MTKIYINQREKHINNYQKRDDIIICLLELLVGAITLMISSSIFRGFYIENIFYAFIAATVISLLNLTIKPLLVCLTLPLTVSSLGLLYPIVNVIILKLASFLMGDVFIIKGLILPFFIAIFISIMTKFLHRIVVKPYVEGR